MNVHSAPAGGRPLALWLVLCCLALLSSMALSPVARAQQLAPQLPDTAVPRKPIYGVALDSMWLGGVLATHSYGSEGQLWAFMKSLGLNILEMRSADLADTLADSTSVNPNGKLIVWDFPLWQAGFGREVIVYPFDSVQSYYWQNKFLYQVEGTDRKNPIEANSPRERVYATDSTSPNDTILKKLTFNYQSYQIHRYPDGPFDSLVQDARGILDQIPPHSGFETYYIDVTGHLFSVADGGGTAGDNDSLLELEIWNEMPAGTVYIDSTMPIDVYITKAVGIDSGVAVDTVLYCELWDSGPHYLGYATPQVSIIPASGRTAFLAAIDQTFAPTPILVHDSTAAAVNLTALTNAEAESYPPARMSFLRHRRDSLLLYTLGAGPVRNTRTTLADQTRKTHRDSLTTHKEFLYQTLTVRKSDLKPASIFQSFDVYHHAVLPISMVRMPGSMSGPLDAENRSHRFDLRVRWTGAEKLALRSIALRDSVGQLMIGADSSAIKYRAGLLQLATRWMHGSDDTTAPLRSAIIRFYSGDEGFPAENPGYNVLDSMLYKAFPTGDTATRGVRAYRAQTDHNLASQATLSSANEITCETYYGDVVYGIGDSTQWGIASTVTPSILQHNGNRYATPLLGLTHDSVDLYTRAFQRVHLGQYHRGHNDWPYGGDWAGGLGNAAWNARRTGKRLIQWPGIHTPINFHWSDSVYINPTLHDTTHTWVYRRLVGHIPEAAELRAMVNLGLCYGSRGVHYSWIGSTRAEFYHDDRPGYYRVYTDFGPVGPTISDTANHFDVFRFDNDYTYGTHLKDSLVDFYTGWGVRLAEMRWLDTNWLPRIGRAMAKLHWRDGYSMHFTVPQTYMHAPLQTTSRPLPSTEIVTGVQSWKPSIDGAPVQIDPQSETYVELGMFDTVKGADTGQRIQDAQYVYVVNRRTFERPIDVAALSDAGLTMDSLAETRTISLKLNIPHPDPSSYNFVRVTEIEPDTTSIPLLGRPQGLDTIVYGDSAIAVTLRPGGAALLKITYAPAGTAFLGGDIRYNNQRKMVFDGLRYHACYYKQVKYRYPFPKSDPHWKQFTGFEDAIYYRRSLPAADTAGGIRWEPIEYLVSDTTADSTVRENRFPSMSVRVAGDRSGGTKNDDTIITIVWSRYKGPGTRCVCLRNIRVHGDTVVQIASKQEVIGIYAGANDGASGEPAWGTPVVSRLDGGDMVAWSDSAQGICARLRVLGSGAAWWQPFAPNVGYTPVFTITSPLIAPGWSASPPGICMFPSMPSEGHVRGLDSSIGIVWQDMQSGVGTSRIDYARLVHRVAGGQDWMSVINTRIVSQGDIAINVHPSIDAAQDIWYDVQEGVTWEGRQRLDSRTWGTMQLYAPPPPSRDVSMVCFSSLFTPTSRRIDPAHPFSTTYWNPFWDDIKPTQQWTYSSYILANTAESWAPYFVDFYPNTSSTNARSDTDHQHEKIHFSLATSEVAASSANNFFTAPMRQAVREYAVRSLPPFLTYAHGGFYANGASSPTHQPLREAVLYRINTGSLLTQTSRQFFARAARPSGYMAQGRQVSIPVNDTIAAGFSLGMYDAWVADNSASYPLAMAACADSVRIIDSLPQVQAMMRTGYFHAHDSTEIGGTFNAHSFGDTSLIDSARVPFVIELVDSATGSVVHTLDSFCLSDTTHDYYAPIDTVLDLMSGTYYLRMRLAPENLPALPALTDSRFSMTEIAGDVGDSLIGKLRHLDAVTGAKGRLSVYPNPTSGAADIVFSVPDDGPIAITIYDGLGRRITAPMEGTMAAGRYAIDINGDALPPGTYMVEFRYGENRLVEKLVIVR